MKSKIFVSIILILFFNAGVNANPDLPIEGKSIFMSRCAGCHNVKKPLTGPALAGIDERRSMDWIINFVHSSQSMVKKGDKDAVAIFEKFNRIPMPDHADLTSDHIKSIVEFIKSESKPVEENKAPFAKPGKKLARYDLISTTDYWLFGALVVSVLLLIGALVFASRVRAMKENYNRKLN